MQRDVREQPLPTHRKKFLPMMQKETRLPGAANAQSICDAIDVIEPRSDEGDLKNSTVIEAYGTKSGVIFRAALRGVLG